MDIMLERIRSVSTVMQPGNGYSATSNVSDDVFNQPSGSNVHSESSKRQTQCYGNVGMRPSVIQTSSKSENNLQMHYNVPVSNSFSSLLN